MVESSGCISRSRRCLVEGAHHQPIVRIGWNAYLLQDAAKEILGLSSRQISENNDDRFVVRVVAVDRLSGHQKLLVAVYELDDIWRVPAGAPLSSKPKRLMLPGHRHEGAHRPGAAEVLVRPGHKSLDPIGDGAKFTAIAFREFPRPTGVLEILKEKEIGDLLAWDSES